MKFLFIPILILLTTLLYYPALGGPYVLDDFNNLIHTDGHFNFWQLVDYIFHNTSGPLKRPISLFSFYVGDIYLGSNSFPAKAINLFIYVCCGLLVYQFVKGLQLFQDARQKYFCTFITALFMLHPLNISTVLYTVQRMTLLSSFFMLCGFCYFIKQYEQASSLRGRSALMILVFFVLALFSKENGLLLPFYLSVISFLLYPKQRNAFYLSYLPSAVIVLFVFLSYPSWRLGYSHFDFDLTTRLFYEASIQLYYLKLIFLPNLHDLSLYHDDLILTLPPLQNVLSLGLWGLIFLTAFYLRRTHPLVLFGVAWFIVGHLMESTVFPLELAFEHRNFLPMLGPLITAGYYFFQICERVSLRMGMILSCGILMTLCVLTCFRAQTWATMPSLAMQHYQTHPLSVNAGQDYANVLVMQDEPQQALQIIEANALRFPKQAGPLLHQWGFYCDKWLPASLAHQTLSTLHSASDIFDSAHVLLSLNESAGQQHCSGIRVSTLRGAILALLENPVSHSDQNTVNSLQTALARMHFYTGNSERALHLLDEFYEETGEVAALLQKSEMQWQKGNVIDANATLQTIKKLHYTTIFPYFYQIMRLDNLFAKER